MIATLHKSRLECYACDSYRNLQYLICLISLLLCHSCNVRNKPENIDEAIIELDNILSNEQKLTFKNQEEDPAVFELYKGLGRKIHYSWFVEDKRPQKNLLLDQLFDFGIEDSETGMKIILKSYHRKLNGKKVDYIKQIEEYKKYSKIEISRNRDESNFSKFQVSDEIEITMHIDSNRNIILDSFVHVEEFDPKKDLKLDGTITKKFIDSAKSEKFFKVKINNINLNYVKYSSNTIKIGKEYIFKVSNLRINKHR